MSKSINPYSFFKNYCIRTPIFSLDFYENLARKSDCKENLCDLWSNNSLKEAFFLASPELHSLLEAYFNSDTTDIAKGNRLKNTFFKYASRSSTRCTPFGLFAGIGVGSFSKDTSNIHLKSHHKRKTHFDMNYITSLLHYIATSQHCKEQLLFYPNTTLYLIANQYRYIEYQLKGVKRTYSIEGVEASTYLNKIVATAKTGKTINNLAAELVSDDITLSEAKNFIEILIENQVLVSELEPSVTGIDMLEKAIEVLSRLQNVKKESTLLTSFQKQLSHLDKNIGHNDSIYNTIIDTIASKNISFEKKYLFQTDLFIQTTSNHLHYKHAYTLKRVLPFLNKLTVYKENKNLERFKNAFLERYESRAIPLALALDVESGIGYIQHSAISDTTPFLNDITPKEQIGKTDDSTFSEVDKIIYKKLLQSQTENSYILELKDEDFIGIEVTNTHLPDTLSAFVEIINCNNEETIAVRGVGAGAANLLARFCHGDDDLLTHVQNITSLEQQMNPNKILAEIVHLPEARIGNILKRPSLRAYEIPYLAKSSLPLSQQITVDDLLVSIKQNRIVLWSKRLQKEVLPRLTNAHNYEKNSLPIYQFLCNLQMQHTKPSIGFSWPSLAHTHSFLPRVTYKNIILSKAKWYLFKEDIILLMSYYNESSIVEKISYWRTKKQLPQYILLVESDNTLMIDLENNNTVRILLDTIKNKEKVLLEEFLFLEDTIVKNKEERYTNECIISFYNEHKLKSIS